jgi:putative endonuclease
MKSREIGDMGEAVAEKYLKKRGWKILSNNYSTREGEIDIIGYRFGVLTYFEVKARSDDSFGSPADAVDGEKINKIKSAARHFIKAYGANGKIPVGGFFGGNKIKNIRKERIDVVEIYFTRDYKLRGINHIKDWGSRL